jgi:hypothetical protein
VDYISRNLTVIKIFASLIAGIFVASKVYAFATAIGLLIPVLTAFTAAAGSACIATALLTGGFSAGAATAALGAFVITAGAIGVSLAASSKNADKAAKSYKGVQDISSKLGATTNGLNKVVKTNTVITTNNATAVTKLTAAQLLSEKVQKQLQKLGAKPTSETDPIQLEAARLNLIKQQNLAIQAVDASYLAFIEKQMMANENAQRYADILSIIKDGKITTEEIDKLAKAWGIPREAVIAYITKVTGLAQTDFAGFDVPGLSAASGWIKAKAALDAYYAALKQDLTGGKSTTDVAAVAAGIGVTPSALAAQESGSIGAASIAAQMAAAQRSLAAIGVTPSALASQEGGSIGAASIAAQLSAVQGSTSMGATSLTPTTNNFYITTVDPTKAGDAVVDAINSSTNIRGGYQGIGVSRAVTLL